MTDASLLLQGGVFEALANDTDVQALVAQRIYDTVPHEPVYPYVHFADTLLTGEFDGCSDHYEVFQDIHVWSRRPGSTELKQLCAAIRKATESVTIEVGNLVYLSHVSTRYLTDPNPAIRHGVISFKASIGL